MAMVQEFWIDRCLSSNSINGIVKLVLKCTDLLDLLDHWCKSDHDHPHI